MGRFENQTVIVTGGARGMGASYARGFVAEGANVVICDVLEREGAALSAELGDQAVFAFVDVTSEDGWSKILWGAEAAFGPVSVLVNNARTVRTGMLEQTEPAAWRRVIDVNLTGQYLGIRAVVPSMRKARGGAIINISSTLGLVAVPMSPAYVASEWGVRGLTKAAALELGRDNIRVNSVHPATSSDSDEVTRLVLFVASEEARLTTGSEFVADGGMVLGAALQPEVAGTAAP